MAVLFGVSELGLHLEIEVWKWVVFGMLLLTFNTVACWEYFVKRRAELQLGQKAWIIFILTSAIEGVVKSGMGQ